MAKKTRHVISRQSADPRQKIKTLEDLAATLAALRGQGRRVVLSHGVFDLLHVGHIRHFRKARELGDVLVVTVTPDRHVNKGPGRPAFTDSLRAESIASLDMVDYVAINRWPTAVETIAMLRPNIFVKGKEYSRASDDITGGISEEGRAIENAGGEIRFTDDVVFSSSRLLNAHMSPFPPATDHYLEQFRRRHSIDEVLEWIDRASRLKPVVVGEAILDEYDFCDVIGKSTKDPVLAVLWNSSVRYAGGALAIANHIAGLCPDVSLVTMLGEMEREEGFVRSQLASNIDPVLLTKPESPTIRKRRTIDRYSGNKLFETYRMNDAPVSGAAQDTLVAVLDSRLPEADVTIVADYGHGLLSESARGAICGRASFVALNSQSNAGNRGFNPVSRYRRADYVCLARHELELETRSRESLVKESITDVARRIDCPRFTVTQGKEGTIHYDAENGFFEAPSLATRVVDRVGAGDAVLAVTSLLVRCGAPWEIVAFIGNAAGAELVSQLGNQAPLTRLGLTRHLVTLLK